MASTDATRAAPGVSGNGPQEDRHAGEHDLPNSEPQNETQARRPLDEIGSKFPVCDVGLASIKDGGAQMRVEMHPETINEYAEAMLNGAVFPPIILFYDETDYWPGDGFHRIKAARKIERDTISAEVRKGTARDAILYGIGANATHGLRRTQADKRRAVEKLFTDPEWARWSDRKIAETAKVDHKTVAKIRREMSGEIPTGKSMGGEVPKRPDKPNGSGSILEAVLHSVSDEALIAECRRRGLVVEALDV